MSCCSAINEGKCGRERRDIRKVVRMVTSLSHAFPFVPKIGASNAASARSRTPKEHTETADASIYWDSEAHDKIDTQTVVRKVVLAKNHKPCCSEGSSSTTLSRKR